MNLSVGEDREDVSEVEISAGLLRAILALGRRMRSTRSGDGLSGSGYSLLGTLALRGPLPAARLAMEEGLQPQSLTRVIAALEAQRLIARRRNETDRREILLSLTPEGREALAREMRRRRAWLEAAIAETLTDEERGRLGDVVSIVARLARFGGRE